MQRKIPGPKHFPGFITELLAWAPGRTQGKQRKWSETRGYERPWADRDPESQLPAVLPDSSYTVTGQALCHRLLFPLPAYNHRLISVEAKQTLQLIPRR
jgi:hypothetical protein